MYLKYPQFKCSGYTQYPDDFSILNIIIRHKLKVSASKVWWVHAVPT